MAMRMRLAMLCAAAWAAQAVAADDAVVISGTRVDQPSLTLPMSIDRLYSEEIREGRPQVNLSESMGRVPGITVLNRQNYAQDLQISSRGFGARSTFGVRGIRLISDGVPASMPDGQGQASTFDLGSAERIEVLRGPFSSLYGNSAGGVINVITEDAPPEPTLDIGLYGGSYNTWRSALKFGGQWGALNAVGDVSRFSTDGYRDHSAAVRDQLNAKGRFALGEASGLTLVATSLRQPETQDPLGLTAAQVAQNPRQVVPQATQFDTRKTIEHDQAGATFDHAFTAKTRLQASAWTGTRFVEQYLAIPLATQAGIAHSGGVVNLDRDFAGGALRLFSDQSLGGRTLRLSAGAEYERMDERRRGYINNLGVKGALKRDEDNVVDSTGLYAQGEWLFAEQWSAHLGVRSTQVSFKSTDFFITANPANGDDSGAKDYSATTPVAGLLYRLDPVTSLYANFGRGFETPTFAELSYRNSGAGLNLSLEAAESRHFEIGAKMVRDGAFRANVALYDIETENEIVTDQSSGGRTTFRNAGRTQRRGLELAAESLVAGPIEARAAYTYLDAVFEDGFATVTGTPAVPATVAPGNMLPGVPRHQFYAEGAWRYAPAGLRLAAEYLYRSQVAVNDINSEFAPSYGVFNVVFGLEQRGARWRLSEFLRIDNVGDRAYIGSVVVNDANGRYYEPAPPRTSMLGVQASLRF
jgi:iron complex outermembrane receptor protein